MKKKRVRRALAARRLDRINALKEELADTQYSLRKAERKYQELLAKAKEK